MTVQKNDHNPHSGAKAIYRFLAGGTLGAFIVAIFISYGSPRELNFVQFGLAAFLVLCSGLLSSIWGQKFIDIVVQGLDSFTL